MFLTSATWQPASSLIHWPVWLESVSLVGKQIQLSGRSWDGLGLHFNQRWSWSFYDMVDVFKGIFNLTDLFLSYVLIISEFGVSSSTIYCKTTVFLLQRQTGLSPTTMWPYQTASPSRTWPLVTCSTPAWSLSTLVVVVYLESSLNLWPSERLPVSRSHESQNALC